ARAARCMMMHEHAIAYGVARAPHGSIRIGRQHAGRTVTERNDVAGRLMPEHERCAPFEIPAHDVAGADAARARAHERLAPTGNRPIDVFDANVGRAVETSHFHRALTLCPERS